MPSSSVVIISRAKVYPDQKSTTKPMRLSVSDLPMLSCHYIQKGVLLPSPVTSQIADVITLLKESLSRTLSQFPPLAGRLDTDEKGHVYIVCNDLGVDFVHAKAESATLANLLPPRGGDIPVQFRGFFQYDRTLSYAGHFKPLVAVQVTELNDAVFVGLTANHAVVDGTSFWNFFNAFAEVASGAKKLTKSPVFRRDTVFDSPSVLDLPEGGPSATFSGDEPLREKIFHFSREAILKLKFRANSEGLGALKGKITDAVDELRALKRRDPTAEISSFQSLCAQLWRSVTRARKLDPTKTTTFRMAVNCRHRLDPSLEHLYFGNAIQSIPTLATAGELLSNTLNWASDKLHQNVVAHNNDTVRRWIKDWENSPRLFPLGNFDGAMITMGSSPRFPMYDNDFGWGRPLAVRSGGANKFDGKISAFQGCEGDGSVDLEVVLKPETMAGLENDYEFMQYVS